MCIPALGRPLVGRSYPCSSPQTASSPSQPGQGQRTFNSAPSCMKSPTTTNQYLQALNSAAMHFTTPTSSTTPPTPPATANTGDDGRPAGEQITPVGGERDIRNPNPSGAVTPPAYVKEAGERAAQRLREQQGEIIPSTDSDIIGLVRQGSPQEGEGEKTPAQEAEAALADNTSPTVP